jgi:predicted glycoside hydrolase/deacetylase ChbG (UPF0249 family)
MTQHTKLIINADDFGKSEAINQSIVWCFQKKLITNTTIMTNMSSYPAAVLLAKRNGFENSVGLHLNFYEGTPLSNEMKNCPLFLDSCGRMTSQHILHQKKLKKFCLSKKEKIAIAEETKAQIYSYLSSGFREMHFDSHGHSHTLPAIYQTISPILFDFGFRSSRISQNLSRSSVGVALYKRAFNKAIQKRFICTDFFSSVSVFESSHKIIQNGDSVEVMVHPQGIEGDLFVDFTPCQTLAKFFSDVCDPGKYDFVSFANLKII